MKNAITVATPSTYHRGRASSVMVVRAHLDIPALIRLSAAFPSLCMEVTLDIRAPYKPADVAGWLAVQSIPSPDR